MALTVALVLPAAVAVPETKPGGGWGGFTLNPAGRLLGRKLVGVLVAAIW